MENAPVISIMANSPTPGADLEVYERYRKWSVEVYAPLAIGIPEVAGIETYNIINQTVS
jgi:hypothetical protein